MIFFIALPRGVGFGGFFSFARGLWVALRIKCWVVTYRTAFMSTVADLGVIGVSSGVVRMVYR